MSFLWVVYVFVVYGLSFGCLWVVKLMLRTMILKILRTKSWFLGAMVCQAKTEFFFLCQVIHKIPPIQIPTQILTLISTQIPTQIPMQVPPTGPRAGPHAGPYTDHHTVPT